VISKDQRKEFRLSDFGIKSLRKGWLQRCICQVRGQRKEDLTTTNEYQEIIIYGNMHKKICNMSYKNRIAHTTLQKSLHHLITSIGLSVLLGIFNTNRLKTFANGFGRFIDS
jgi:hypothetical protein